MTEKIQQSLRDSKSARWIALILLASSMFFGYIFVDILSPLQEALMSPKAVGGLGWSATAYGRFAGSETFLNVFIFFLIFAGVILDKMGVRFTGILSAFVMLIGGSIKYMAVKQGFDDTAFGQTLGGMLNLPDAVWNITPFVKGMPASAKLASIGFMIFGCGVEMGGITVSRGIVKWFKGKELALAMGTEMAIARMGVAFVMVGSPFIAYFRDSLSISRSVGFSVLLLIIGLFGLITYFFMDRKLENEGVKDEGDPDEEFKISDLGKILGSRVFWLVALLCVLYYSAIFPFQKYAINMLQSNLGYTATQAGAVFFWFPIGAAIITPVLGNFLDRHGKGASMLILGAILMIACHLTFAFALPAAHGTVWAVVIAYAAIVLLGISFSLVPATLWPSVPKLVDEKLLGSAYAVIFWIQNIGLYAFPMIIGSVLASSNPDVTDPLTGLVTKVDPAQLNYTVPMLVFTGLGVAALFFAIILKALDKKKGYGLELPNIEELLEEKLEATK